MDACPPHARRLVRSLALTLLVAFGIALSAPAVVADDEKATSPDERVAALEEAVKRLEERVRRLEEEVLRLRVLGRSDRLRPPAAGPDAFVLVPARAAPPAGDPPAAVAGGPSVRDTLDWLVEAHRRTGAGRARGDATTSRRRRSRSSPSSATGTRTGTRPCPSSRRR